MLARAVIPDPFEPTHLPQYATLIAQKIDLNKPTVVIAPQQRGSVKLYQQRAPAAKRGALAHRAGLLGVWVAVCRRASGKWVFFGVCSNRISLGGFLVARTQTHAILDEFPISLATQHIITFYSVRNVVCSGCVEYTKYTQ